MEADLQFGGWLRAQRHQWDLTQEELAERASCSVQMIKKIEAGRARPSRQLALILLACLGIPEAEQPLFTDWARGGSSKPESAASRPQSARTVPNNVPAEVGRFIGR